jgi:hypothetical protein
MERVQNVVAKKDRNFWRLLRSATGALDMGSMLKPWIMSDAEAFACERHF